MWCTNTVRQHLNTNACNAKIMHRVIIIIMLLQTIDKNYQTLINTTCANLGNIFLPCAWASKLIDLSFERVFAPSNPHRLLSEATSKQAMACEGKCELACELVK